MSTVLIRERFKQIPRGKWLKKLQHAADSEKSIITQLSQQKDMENGLAISTSKLLGPIVKATAAVAENQKEQIKQADIESKQKAVRHTESTEKLNKLCILFQTYIDKLSETNSKNLQNILTDIKFIADKQVEITSKMNNINEQTTNELQENTGKLDKLIDNLKESGEMKDERIQELTGMLDNIRTENEELKARLPGSKIELVEIILKELPQLRPETLDDNVFNSIYKNTDNTIKSKTSLKQLPVPTLQEAIKLYREKQTTGSGINHQKELDTVNLLLASNKAGNTAGFAEFDNKLKKLVEKKVINKSTYNKFIKSWRQ